MHNSRSMRTDEQDPKAPRPIDDGVRTINPLEDPKQPSPFRMTKKRASSLEMVEQYGRTTVGEDRDRHLHV